MNEVRARSRNEWIQETTNRLGPHPEMGDWVCECSFRRCPTIIHLTADEYEGVRRNGTFFAIAIDHENPEIDRVIAENERFAVVDKWFGEPRRMARATDPRRLTPGPKEANAMTS